MNKQKIRLLKEAYRIIKAGDEDFVCIALDEAHKRVGNDYNVDALRELKHYIRCALEHRGTLNSWMIECSGRDYNTLSDVFMRRARMQWIKWMIACLEGEPNEVNW